MNDGYIIFGLGFALGIVTTAISLYIMGVI